MIVVDASVLAVALADDGQDGDHARARLRREQLTAPGLVDLEVASVWRRQIRDGAMDARRAALALADLAALPLRRAAHQPLLARCWELRDKLTIYDASYVARRWEAGHRHVEIGLNQLYANAALARLRRGLTAALEVTLLTGDGRLARSTGPRCPIEVLRSAP